MRGMKTWVDRLGDSLDAMGDSLEASFGDFFNDAGRFTLTRNRCNVQKGKDVTVITVEVPGMSHKDITIKLANTTLSVVGKIEPSKGHVIAIENKFRVSPEIDMSDIKATVKNGLLTITIKRDDVPDAPKGTVNVTKG